MIIIMPVDAEVVVKNNVENNACKSLPVWGKQLARAFENRMRVSEAVYRPVHLDTSHELGGINILQARDSAAGKVSQ